MNVYCTWIKVIFQLGAFLYYIFSFVLCIDREYGYEIWMVEIKCIIGTWDLTSPFIFYIPNRYDVRTYIRECVSTGAAGARTRRFSEHHLLHPLILRLLVLCALADFEAQIPNAFLVSGNKFQHEIVILYSVQM